MLKEILKLQFSSSRPFTVKEKQLLHKILSKAVYDMALVEGKRASYLKNKKPQQVHTLKTFLIM